VKGHDIPENAPTWGSPGRRYTVVYDGYCNVCKKLVAVLTKLDRNHELEILPSQTPGLHARFPWIPERAYVESIQLIDHPTETTWQGVADIFDSIRTTACREVLPVVCAKPVSARLRRALPAARSRHQVRRLDLFRSMMRSRIQSSMRFA
jgi:predicted DCC family thiol-disulfide oxidoreductase YuxK